MGVYGLVAEKQLLGEERQCGKLGVINPGVAGQT